MDSLSYSTWLWSEIKEFFSRWKWYQMKVLDEYRTVQMSVSLDRIAFVDKISKCQKGSSTGNLPSLRWASPIKRKLSAIQGLITLRLLIQKSYELSLGIIVFLAPQNTIFWSTLTICHHFVTRTFFYNDRW